MQLSSKNEPKFNSLYSRNKLPKIKDGAYVINLDGYKSIGTHWINLYLNAENVTHFDSFAVEYIQKKKKKIHRKQKYNKYLQNTNMLFDNVWILLYCIY